MCTHIKKETNLVKEDVPENDNSLPVVELILCAAIAIAAFAEIQAGFPHVLP